MSLVVPVHDEAHELDDLLARLGALLRADDELLLVEGGSSDGTAERLRSPGAHRHRVVDAAPGCGPAAARNAGIAVARHPLIACTDAGCEPDPAFLDALRVAFADAPSDEPVQLVTGVYRVRARTVLETAAAVGCYPAVEEASGGSALARVYGPLLGRRFVAREPTGRSIAFTRDAWERVGGFPEALRTNEDVTFGTRVADTGAPLRLSADAVVTWDQRPTLRATARMYYSYGVGGARGRDRRAVARDLARLVAYAGAAPLVLWGGTPGIVAVGVGAAAYLSLPLARVRRERHSPAVALVLPLVLAVKDLAKAAGCVRGLTMRPLPGVVEEPGVVSARDPGSPR